MHSMIAPTRPFGLGTRMAGAAAAMIASLTLWSATAWSDDRCPPHDATAYSINVEADIPAARLDRSRSRAQLNGFAPHGKGGNVLGLMRAGYEFSMSSSYAYDEVDGGYCFWVDIVDVMLRYQSMDVYVAKEYRPGSCAYRAILAHEQTHVDIARTFVQRYRPRVRSALTSLRIPTARAPNFVNSIEQARVQSNTLLGQLLNPVIRQLEKSMNDAQAELDTPQSYRRVLRQCSDW